MILERIYRKKLKKLTEIMEITLNYETQLLFESRRQSRWGSSILEESGLVENITVSISQNFTSP